MDIQAKTTHQGYSPTQNLKTKSAAIGGSDKNESLAIYPKMIEY